MLVGVSTWLTHRVKQNCNVAILQGDNKWGGMAIMLHIHIWKVLSSSFGHNTNYSEGFSFFSSVPPGKC
jgi:hypothetical protein